MFCTNCGSQLDDRAVICPHCGCATENYYKTNQHAQYSSQVPPVSPVAPMPVHVQSKPVNGFAIAALVLGIAGLWFGMFFGIVPIIGLIFSIIGMSQASKTNSGRGLAIGGLVTSIVGILFWGLIWIIALASASGGVYY